MRKLYTVKALAELFEKDEETIRCWIREGIFPSAFKIKDGWYVPASDIKKMMRISASKESASESRQTSAPRQSSGFVTGWK